MLCIFQGEKSADDFESVSSDVFLQHCQIALGQRTQFDLAMLEPAHGDVIINVQWNRNDFIVVKLAADDAGADGVAVQSDHQVENRRTVADFDAFFVAQGAENFFGEVKRVDLALFV